MAVEKLVRYLAEHQVDYETMTHTEAYTAQEVAASAHIPGRELAKTVMVKLDGELAMAVLRAPDRVDLERLGELAGAGRVELASEDEFRETFPECEAGAMPPFGNLWGMEVFVDEALREDDEIAFNAGNHRELVRLAYEEFEDLVEPRLGRFAERRG